jgi:hypothetical protein
MDWLLKVIDCVVWLLIFCSIAWLVYGCYDLINLFFGR